MHRFYYTNRTKAVFIFRIRYRENENYIRSGNRNNLEKSYFDMFSWSNRFIRKMGFIPNKSTLARQNGIHDNLMNVEISIFTLSVSAFLY